MDYRYHYLLVGTNLTPVQRIALTQILDQNGDDVYAPAADMWLLCSAVTPQPYRDRLIQLFQGTYAGFLLLDLRAAFVAGGLLPADAWTWLKRHGLM